MMPDTGLGSRLQPLKPGEGLDGEVVEFDYMSPRRGNAMTYCRMTPCRSSAGKVLGAILVLQERVESRDPMAA